MQNDNGSGIKFDVNGLPKSLDMHLTNVGDRQRVQEVMKATGVSSPQEAILLVFRRYHADFLAWWDGDASKAPLPLTRDLGIDADTLESSTLNEGVTWKGPISVSDGSEVVYYEDLNCEFYNELGN